MAYANHAYRHGLGGYCRQLAGAGISGTIIPDLPAAEAGDYIDAARVAGLDATLMVTPATPEPDIAAIAARSRGFLYVMSVMATTGTTSESADAERWTVAARARRHSSRPVLIGFGIDTPDRAAAAARHADGVIVASALMRRVLDGASSAAIGRDVARLRTAVDQARGSPAVSPARRTADDRQPKYLRIHGALRDRITSGQWPPGIPLPAQRDLAGEFGVSIMTLRQALQLLADDGLIDTRHGSGTFVASRYAYHLGHLRSFAADLAGQGAEISTRLLAADTIAPPEASGRPARARDRIGLGHGAASQVLRLRRRPARRRPLPVIVQTSYLPSEPGPGDRSRRPVPARAVHGAGRARAGRLPGPRRPSRRPCSAGPTPRIWNDPRGRRRCSATRSASRPTARRSSTTTRCCPATAWPSRPAARPMSWTCTTRSLPAERSPPGLCQIRIASPPYWWSRPRAEAEAVR